MPAKSQCNECNTDLTGIDDALPCPVCGKLTTRTIIGEAHLAAEFQITARAGVLPKQGPSWETQWIRLLHAHKALTAYYASDENGVDGRSAFHDACGAAYALAEHLPERREGMSYRRQSGDLRDIEDVCNTEKHGVRHQGETTARILSDLPHEPDGHELVVQFSGDQNQVIKTRDGLDIVRTAIESWADYLDGHSLPHEGWPPTP